MIIMKKVNSKNSARVGPIGQTRLVNTTMCNAGFPIYIPSFMSEARSNKVSMGLSGRKRGRNWRGKLVYIEDTEVHGPGTDTGRRLPY